jgi:hypothetical protein
MSETSTLISCTGKITRAELANLPTPPATATHVPIPHAAVVETLVETLSHRHIGVVDEEFAVSSDAMEMFGVLTRTMKKIESKSGGLKRKVRDRMRSIRKRVLAIALSTRLLGRPEKSGESGSIGSYSA